MYYLLEGFTFVRFIFQMFSSVDESLKNETRLLLLLDGSLATLHFFVLILITSVVKPVHIFIVKTLKNLRKS